MSNKKFSLTETSKFDLETYSGRLRHFAKLTNMLLFRYGDSDLENFKSILLEYEKDPNNVKWSNRDDELWDYKYAVKSTMNAETGKILPLPFRMYLFVPMNIPIAFGLTCLPATAVNIAFFNFVNQTYNASINYFNSSGTSDSQKLLVISYTLAITSSIGSGLIFRRLLMRNNNEKVGILKNIIVRILPSSIAGFLNLFWMRFDYILNGITIKNEEGKTLAKSKKIGVKAVLEGGLSRMFLGFPLILQIISMTYLRKKLKSQGFLKFLDIFLISIALGIGLPFSIAIFKDYTKIHSSKIETDLLEKLRKENINDEWFYYNKGI